MTKPLEALYKFQTYKQRQGHDINGVRPVMIPDDSGEWVNRFDAEHLAEQLKRAQSRISELESRQLSVPKASFYRDGVAAAAKWVDQQRESYDNEHGRHDPDTGTFEFGNDVQSEYSAMLADIAEGIRSLHPNTALEPLNNSERAELLAYRDASKKPVGWTDAVELRDVEKDGCGYLFKINPITPHADPRRVIKLYAAPPVQAVLVPDGWKLLPVEPTYQMSEAIGLPWEYPPFPLRYARMIAAAPKLTKEP